MGLQVLYKRESDPSTVFIILAFLYTVDATSPLPQVPGAVTPSPEWHVTWSYETKSNLSSLNCFYLCFIKAKGKVTQLTKTIFLWDI